MMKCSVARWKISSALDAGQNVTGSVADHLLQCAACRHFHEEARILDDALVSERTGELRKAEYLHTRIMASVKEAGSEPQESVFAPKRVVLVACVAALALAVVLLRTAIWPGGQIDNEVPGQVAALTVPAADVDEYRRVAAQAASEASVAATLAMADEMENLKADVSEVSKYLLACID
jgi:predicted anti-sigma-YlaC factor YlaD